MITFVHTTCPACPDLLEPRGQFTVTTMVTTIVCVAVIMDLLVSLGMESAGSLSVTHSLVTTSNVRTCAWLAFHAVCSGDDFQTWSILTALTSVHLVILLTTRSPVPETAVAIPGSSYDHLLLENFLLDLLLPISCGGTHPHSDTLVPGCTSHLDDFMVWIRPRLPPPNGQIGLGKK